MDRLGRVQGHGQRRLDGAQVGSSAGFAVGGDPGQERGRLAGVAGPLGLASGPTAGPLSCCSSMAGVAGGTRNRMPGKSCSRLGRLIREVERAVDEHRNRRGAGVGLEVGQGVGERPAALEQVVADQDQLDVGRLGRGEEALLPVSSSIGS